MKRIYFGSVIYPNGVTYADVFFDNLEKQSRKDFILLLLNDGVDKDILTDIVKKHNINTEIISYSDKYTPAELRIELLKEAKCRQADYLVLGDIDDMFSHNRVQVCINAFESDNRFEFIYNKFLLMDGKNAMPELPAETNKLENILEYNYLGLSNTALSMKRISEKYIDSLHECKSQVFDWYFFSRLLLGGMIGRFVEDAITYYRVYEDNYAGIPSMVESMVGKEISVKVEHYKSLRQYGIVFEELYKAYTSNSFEINTRSSQYYWWNLTRKIDLDRHSTTTGFSRW